MMFRIKRASGDEYDRPAKYAYSELSDWVQVVKFPTIEELIAFQKENKKIVIMDDYYNHYIPLIIIYDDWLE